MLNYQCDEKTELKNLLKYIYTTDPTYYKAI